MEIVPGNTSTGGVKHKRGSKIIAISDLSTAISRKRCKIGGKLVLITMKITMKSYMSFRLVPKSVTLNDLERRNGRYFALLQQIFVYDVAVKIVMPTSVSESTFNTL